MFVPMASFTAHLGAAVSVTGVVATSIMVAGLASADQVILYFTLGVAGGLLPDLDADHSTPLEVAFFILSLLGAFLAVLSLASRLSVIELCLLWGGVLLLLRYGVLRLFTRLTAHRGVFHSLLERFPH